MKKILKLLFDNIEEIVASLLFTVTLLTVILNVILRYVLKTGFPWSEELATSCFVWTTFIGAAACYKQRTLLGVEILVNRMPLKAQNVVKIITDVIMIVLCGYLFYLSILYVRRTYIKPTALLGVSSATVSTSLILCFFDMTIWSVIFVFKDLKSIRKNGRVIITEKGA